MRLTILSSSCEMIVIKKLKFLLHRGTDEKLMLFAIPGRWPSVISVSFQRVCGQSHQNFVLFPWWKLQFCSIHFSETGEGKDKSSNITSGGTSNFLCLSRYISIYMRWWRMHNIEMYNSAKRPQKLLAWKETSARLQSYVVPILFWRINKFYYFCMASATLGMNLKNTF